MFIRFAIFQNVGSGRVVYKEALFIIFIKKRIMSIGREKCIHRENIFLIPGRVMTAPLLPFLRKQESIVSWTRVIPAKAGMTEC
jgi:hypothetical protein